MTAEFGLVNLPTYLLGTLIIVLLPGPNSLFVLSTAARHGVRTGYQAACGVFLGDTVLMVLASAGVASLLRTNPALFSIFKFVGAAYLAWLGINMLRSALFGGPHRAQAAGSEPAGQAGQANQPAQPLQTAPLRRALMVSLLNPKAILFFVAFFIQFVDRSYPHPALSFVLLGLMAQTMSFLYLSALIFSGARLAAEFRRRRRLSAGLTGSAGALFLGFSAKLVTATVS